MSVMDRVSRHSTVLKRRRFALFAELVSQLSRPLTILDVGGSQAYWNRIGWGDDPDVRIVLLNLRAPQVTSRFITGVAGDATAMHQFQDDAFDVVFSNSVIEHVGDFEMQRRMASEVQRVGRRYFVQTPNYYFPLEPHFVFPCFHWLPVSTRAYLLTKRNLGFVKRKEDFESAVRTVQSVRLLTRSEMLQLFPGAHVFNERLLGLTKSLTVYRGF